METEDRVTIDGEELALLEKYEQAFGEVPPVAFLDPQTSKKLMRIALKSKRPITDNDLKSDLPSPIQRQTALRRGLPGLQSSARRRRGVR